MKQLRGHLEGSGWYPEEEGVSPFSLGKFSGMLLNPTLEYKPGFGNPMAGYHGGTAHVHGNLYLIEAGTGRSMEINLSVFGGSCWDNSSEQKCALSGNERPGRVHVIPYETDARAVEVKIVGTLFDSCRET